MTVKKRVIDRKPLPLSGGTQESEVSPIDRCFLISIPFVLLLSAIIQAENRVRENLIAGFDSINFNCRLIPIVKEEFIDT